jgi:hypothetical protein
VAIQSIAGAAERVIPEAVRMDNGDARRWHRLALLGACLPGLWILWPALYSGLVSDDYVSLAMMEGGFAVPRHPLDLFNFIDGSATEHAALQRAGYPWWMPPDFKIAMLRPFASLLSWADRVLFGDALFWHHAHSLAWWVVLVWAALRLYERQLSPALAALAALLFAIDQSHHAPASWLANRGGLISVALGVLGLVAHIRYREQRQLRALAAELGCFSLALLSGEWVFPLFAYVFAYELLAAPAGWPRRALALWPAGLPALAFLGVRRALGYGAQGSGVYIDPLADPLRFVQVLPRRLAVFFGDIVLDVPSDWYAFTSPWRDRILSWDLIPPSLWVRLPGWQSWQIGLGVCGALLLALCLGWALGRASAAERRALGWLLCGAVLALVPVAGSFPSRRLTLVAMLGFAPAFALLLRELARALLAGPQLSWAGHTLLWMLLVVTLELQMFSPLRADLWAEVWHARGVAAWVDQAELDDRTLAAQRVVVLSSLDFPSTFFFPYLWRAQGHPVPRSFYPLSASPHALRLTRVDARSFELESLGGLFLESEGERHFRDEHKRVRNGEVFELPGMRVQVRELLRGHPRTLRFRFDTPLEDPGLVFLSATSEGIRRFELPEVGASTVVQRAGLPDWLRLELAASRRRLGTLPTFVNFEPVPRFVHYGPS